MGWSELDCRDSVDFGHNKGRVAAYLCSTVRTPLTAQPFYTICLPCPLRAASSVGLGFARSIDLHPQQPPLWANYVPSPPSKCTRMNNLTTSACVSLKRYFRITSKCEGNMQSALLRLHTCAATYSCNGWDLIGICLLLPVSASSQVIY